MDEGSFDEYHTPEGGMAAIDENTQGQDGAEPEATGNVQEVPSTRMHNVQHDGVGPEHTGGIRADADRKSTRLNSSHSQQSRMPSSA